MAGSSSEQFSPWPTFLVDGCECCHPCSAICARLVELHRISKFFLHHVGIDDHVLHQTRIGLHPELLALVPVGRKPGRTTQLRRRVRSRSDVDRSVLVHEEARLPGNMQLHHSGLEVVQHLGEGQQHGVVQQHEVMQHHEVEQEEVHEVGEEGHLDIEQQSRVHEVLEFHEVTQQHLPGHELGEHHGVERAAFEVEREEYRDVATAAHDLPQVQVQNHPPEIVLTMH